MSSVASWRPRQIRRAAAPEPRKPKYPFRTLKPGEPFYIDLPASKEEAARVRCAAYMAAKRAGKNITMKTFETHIEFKIKEDPTCPSTTS